MAAEVCGMRDADAEHRARVQEARICRKTRSDAGAITRERAHDEVVDRSHIHSVAME
jgi:hypothetical protein